MVYKNISNVGTRKAEVLNSLIINTTAKANDTTDILKLIQAETNYFHFAGICLNV